MPTRFVVWTTQRTGSTVFWRTLDRHPEVEAHGEMLLPTMTRDDAYAPFLAASAWRRLERRIAPARSLDRYLGQLYRGAPGVRAIGFKLMYNHLTPELRRFLDRERPKLLHLVRGNLLKLLASRVAAEQRGLYHLDPGAAAPEDRVTLDPADLVARLGRIEDEIAGGRTLAEGHDTLEVAYEELLARRDATYARVFAFLGVAPPAAPLPDALRKINPDALPDLVANWGEVREALRGTRFAAHLEA